MIQLQRASAGSGKTFTLARKYIGYLIGVKTPGMSRPRLARSKGEILFSLRQILAITFTNMATTEMKQRIVEKLASLAKANESDDKEELRKIDYLEDFKRDFNASTAQIADVCGMALEVVLNNFGDFNVSTIDSFFQGVLRTFAYETNLTDSYQVEMDSDLLASVGIDTSLEEINAGGNPPVRYWMERLMEKRRDRGANWNVFARSSSKSALYQEFLATAKKMENESYKQNRHSIEQYFQTLQENGLTFRDIYERLEAVNESAVREAHGRMLEAARRFENVMAGMTDTIPFKSSPAKHAQVILRSRPFANCIHDRNIKEETLFKASKVETEIASRSVMLAEGKKFTKTGKPTKLMDSFGSEIEKAEEAAIAMYEAWLDWCGRLKEPRFLYWQAYRDTLLYLGLLQETRRNVSAYLQDNGLVELSDTGVILRRIIDDSEVPFIYERLGSRLSHFLIDEFQDTSTLQWENMSPLLHESVGRGEESLVIGDAKQSIYRFRNADPEIIISRLPEEFEDMHRPCGDSVEENTNWRSDRRIVEFNNFFFHALASRAQDACGLVGNAMEVYSGVVQRPSHTLPRGFVSIKFVSKKESGEKDNSPDPYFADFGLLVSELLARGYRQRDIAFLVNTRVEGTQIIDTFVAYNATLPAGAEKIEFVSEESLLVASSKAVGTVIAALQAVADPHSVTLTDEKDRNRKGLGDIRRIGGHFHLYVMQHGGEPTPELLERFKQTIGTPDDPSLKLQTAVATMQAHTLTALTEMLIGMYLSEEERHSEAPYLAALQDMVLEYSERNPTDVASFLRWWHTTGCRRSITSPKDIDAVKVMTIHKSKGLQFKCVIVPGCSFSLAPSPTKTEWLWVNPDSSVGCFGGETIPLPPKVPVESAKLGSLIRDNVDMEDLASDFLHYDEYRKYAHAYMMDVLNKVYVAFTRAEEELHIYVPVSKTKAPAVRKAIKSAMEENDHTGEDSGETEETVSTGSFTKIGEALLALSLRRSDILNTVDEARREYMPSADTPRLLEIAPEPDDDITDSDKAETANIATESSENTAPLSAYRATEIARIEFGTSRIHSGIRTEESQPTAPDGGYTSGRFPAGLKFRRPQTGILTGEEEESDSYMDPRSEGNIIHEVLERMQTVADLDRSLLRIWVQGKVSARGKEELRKKLTKMLSDHVAAGWFDEANKVMAERTLFASACGRTLMKRPDRVVVRPGGKVIVIDYKTGKEEKSHLRQVSGYVSILRSLTDSSGSPLFPEVEGWLWYLVNDHKVKV